MSIEFKINDITVSAEPGEMIVNVAERYGIEIPTLCHDPKIKSYGACGMCVIEAKGGGKLLRSCSTEVNERTAGMEYYTDTPRTIQARKLALELLMSDHTGDCRPPCMEACPAETDCQGYAGLIANGMTSEAFKLITEKIPLPASIGRVCPHPCEKKCRRGQLDKPVSIAALKRFAGDVNLALGEGRAVKFAAPEVKTGKKIAVVGGGPAGLTAASVLAAKGHSVTIYEAMPEAGGMLRYGIPEYRLPKAVLAKEIEMLKSLGIEIRTGVKIGGNAEGSVSFDRLRADNDAIIVAIGAWVSSKMRVPGEDLKGVVGGIDFLREVALGGRPEIGEKVAICGGGNTAMDACRTAVRLGAKKVYTIYRRTRAEMPAEQVEIDEAEEEGVEFKFLCNPAELIAGDDGRVRTVKAQIMELGEPDASGRRSPVPVEGAFEYIDVDTVIMAIGQGVDPRGFDGLELTRKNTVVADEDTFETNLKGVFACGDVTNKGPGIAVAAIAEAQKAAKAVDSYLMKGDADKASAARKPFLSRRNLSDARVKELYAHRLAEPSERVQMSVDAPDVRRNTFKEFAKGFTKEEAEAEAKRCLECGCMDYFECKLARYAGQYDIHPERIEGFRHDRNMRVESEYFVRDTDKCILCGLCARACEQITGQTVLGLVGRGFDTIVQPEMGLPLSKTDCLSCGLCVSVCPTGALTEKTALEKQVPVKEEIAASTCRMCPAKCRINVASRGNTVTRVLPEKGAEGHVLCALGRFEQPKLIAAGDATELPEGLGGKIAVIVSPVLTAAQLEKVCGTCRELPGLAFVAAEETELVPEAFRQSREFAVKHNFGAGNDAAKVLEDNSFGISGAKIRALGIEKLTEAQKADIAAGNIDVLVTFGVLNVPEAAEKVKIIMRKAAL
ncbi:MAG: FAD-dependent oxidoreductase [Clostridia bacterium]|nr:FAD-dependent oxidoreductase [Clostridia bacterium]